MHRSATAGTHANAIGLPTLCLNCGQFWGGVIAWCKACRISQAVWALIIISGPTLLLVGFALCTPSIPGMLVVASCSCSFTGENNGGTM